ncbi:hypothetical protein CONPUDRAFT_77147 [Coniophora puteana RWD-64-598 SS2]|uniref:Uncharacterized protein n=1 Tax=Coniophora puteana (strain RWD-64-598) TaxID=741705 RepID=A0A5M3M9B8_CONPW|nr:uncharacterized protein CONPUDRAFT_77147 [Coniophora puteana RWD-64-598 SS2]EIW75454.1 hypothetical protein CONPUDRAFT_77147 [Coniophora puteana RWD-64-598 SS2]
MVDDTIWWNKPYAPSDDNDSATAHRSARSTPPPAPLVPSISPSTYFSSHHPVSPSGPPSQTAEATAEAPNVPDTAPAVTVRYARNLGLRCKDTIPPSTWYSLDPAAVPDYVKHWTCCQSCSKKNTQCIGRSDAGCFICHFITKDPCPFAKTKPRPQSVKRMNMRAEFDYIRTTDRVRQIEAKHYDRAVRNIDALKAQWSSERSSGSGSQRTVRAKRVMASSSATAAQPLSDRVESVNASIDALRATIAEINRRLDEMERRLDAGVTVEHLRGLVSPVGIEVLDVRTA